MYFVLVCSIGVCTFVGVRMSKTCDVIINLIYKFYIEATTVNTAAETHYARPPKIRPANIRYN